MSWFNRNSLSVTEAAAAVDNGARLIDVRTAAEWKQGRAVGATHMPPQKLDRQMARLEGDRVLLICRSGSRSGRAAAMLRRAGIDAKNVRGGLNSWQRHQLPITRGGSKR
jgi:rhodanese-related sulfurtransferase